MTITLSSDQAQQILEILSDFHDEQQPDNPEYAAEIDAMCGLLQPQQAKLFTVVYQCDDGYFHEHTGHALSSDAMLDLVESHPSLPSVSGTPVTIVEHGSVTHSSVDIDQPALVGEYLIYRDPAEDASSGLYRVVGAPDLQQHDDHDAETYADSVIQLVNDAGSELEAYPHELRRSF